MNHISSAQQLLLQAAFGEPSVALQSLQQWRSAHPDFQKVGGTDARLFPQIYANIGDLITDQQLLNRLKGAARHSWITTRYRTEFYLKLFAALQELAIPAMLLKGSALNLAVINDHALRWSGDCDLLVPRQHALKAATALTDAGFLEAQPLGSQDLYLNHGVTFRGSAGYLDLHWRLVREIGADELTTEMFRHAREVEIAGAAIRVPCFEHMLFHSLIHGSAWSVECRYDWLADAILILRRAGSDFDWDLLAETATRYGCAAIIGSALVTAADVANAKVPDRIKRKLARSLAFVERREQRARKTPPSRLSRLDHFVLLLQNVRRRDLRLIRRPALISSLRLWKWLFGMRWRDLPFSLGEAKDKILLLVGWSAPEPNGRWTEGCLTSFALLTDADKPEALRLRAYPILGIPERSVIVDFFAGRIKLTQFVWGPESTEPTTHVIRLPASIWKHEIPVLRFRVREPLSPAEVGINDDSRLLGIFVEELRLIRAVHRDALKMPLNLKQLDGDSAVLWEGWSRPESIGCWTVGSPALVRWYQRNEVPTKSKLRIRLVSVAPGREPLRGRFFFNGDLRSQFVLSPPGGRVLELPILGKIDAGQECELRIEVDNPRAPTGFNGLGDSRPLGVMIESLWFETDDACISSEPSVANDAGQAFA